MYFHMTTVVLRKNGVPFSPTTVSIPSEVKEKARELGISMSGTLTQALKDEIAKRKGGNES